VTLTNRLFLATSLRNDKISASNQEVIILSLLIDTTKIKTY